MSHRYHMMVHNDSKINSTIRCSICRAEIVDRSRIYQEKLNFGVICGDCIEKFTEEDLKIIPSLFIAYRGYFGMIDRGLYNAEKYIGELVEELDESGEYLDTDQLSLKMLHNALLHGLTPEEYRNRLAILSE